MGDADDRWLSDSLESRYKILDACILLLLYDNSGNALPQKYDFIFEFLSSVQAQTIL